MLHNLVELEHVSQYDIQDICSGTQVLPQLNAVSGMRHAPERS